VSVRAAQSVNVATPALSTLRIEAAGHFADITEQNGYLIAGLDGASIGSTPYLPATHRFWRLRESGGALLWESSADGLTYMLRTMRMPAPFPLSAVTVHLEASTPAGVATPGAAQWDDYNLPP